MFRDPATEAQLQAALSGLMGVTGQHQKATVSSLLSTRSMLLAKLGQWTGPQTGSGAIVYKISDNIPSMHQALCRCWRRTCDVAAKSLYQMFGHRNCRVIP